MIKGDQQKSPGVIKGVALFLLMLVWCELFLQVGIYYWSGKRFASFQPYVWSPYGLVRNNPKFNSPGYQINTNGFRDIRDYSQIKPPNTIRVMLLGGSVLYAGLGGTPLPGAPRVTSSETISQYLEQYLKDAPSCAGKNIEVMNTAVNMNRISELAPAYLNDYINWNPNIIIVGSSLNNFAGGITASSRLLGFHAWESEFQRLVNDSGISSTMEVVFRRASENFATMAIARKFVLKLGYFIEAKNSSSQGEVSEEKNTQRLNAENLGRFKSYASAMIAAAKTRDQKIAFFWEHDLWNSAEFKPLSNDEVLLQKLNPKLENPFYWQQLKWVQDFSKNAGVQFIDPQIEMRKYDKTIFIDYGHYTAQGNAFMARVISSRLLENHICNDKR